MDDKPSVSTGLRELALFAGAGGGILGGKLLGWRTVCAVEREQYPASVLAARQNDGSLEAFPIWSDVCKFDGRPWCGLVDVVSGGFPCQDISVAGKGAGLDGERSGLWREFARIIREVQPPYVFVENSPMLVTRGLNVVLADLAQMGYDASWGVVAASDVGAPHQRKRVWIYATNTMRDRSQGGGEDGSATRPSGLRSGAWGNQDPIFLPHSDSTECPRLPSRESAQVASTRGNSEHSQRHAGWEVEPTVGRVVDGMAHRVDRLKATGNGQVPLCAAVAWEILRAMHHKV
jgi:DNA (cytosine-5)-methyltransferase 1